MKLSFVATTLGGGVTITGDVKTLSSIEILLRKTAIDSHACDDSGHCMALSQYFEKKKNTVDWITLVAGIVCLRSSIGYKLSRKDHAIICLLEYLLFDALCGVLSEPVEAIDGLLRSLHGLNEHSLDSNVESKVVYLYLCRENETRKNELFKLISSLNPMFGRVDNKYNKQFTGLNRDMLSYSAGEEFLYTL